MSGEEKKRILDMLAEGKITAEEAMQLLEQFGAGAPAGVAAKNHTGEKMLRVRVTAQEADKSTPVNVSVNLPLKVARVAGQLLRMIPPQAIDAMEYHGVNLQEIDWEGMIDALAETGGDIVNVTSGGYASGNGSTFDHYDEDQVNVRIYVE